MIIHILFLIILLYQEFIKSQEVIKYALQLWQLLILISAEPHLEQTLCNEIPVGPKNIKIIPTNPQGIYIKVNNNSIVPINSHINPCVEILNLLLIVANWLSSIFCLSNGGLSGIDKIGLLPGINNLVLILHFGQIIKLPTSVDSNSILLSHVLQEQIYFFGIIINDAYIYYK